MSETVKLLEHDPSGEYRCGDGQRCRWCGGLHYGSYMCPYSPTYKEPEPWIKHEPKPSYAALEARCAQLERELAVANEALRWETTVAKWKERAAKRLERKW